MPDITLDQVKLEVRVMSDQDLFEVLRTLVILRGNQKDVLVLHEFRERFNQVLKQAHAI